MTTRRFVFRQTIANMPDPDASDELPSGKVLIVMLVYCPVLLLIGYLNQRLEQVLAMIAGFFLLLIFGLLWKGLVTRFFPRQKFDYLRQLEVVFYIDRLELCFQDKYRYSIKNNHIKSYHWQLAQDVPVGQDHGGQLTIHTLDNQQYVIRQQQLMTKWQMAQIAGLLKRIIRNNSKEGVNQ